ncbi:Alpha/Beta hydrolase protein [Chaetomidium leptoderma]|uniref:Alpha/Beta hydrolase protein n=1 Tax=Chaetomidium leptoderma TaxID=669021 RepID=A0AAN6VKF9_9PEZI|nr:Alpha/Beta hydrolase protein [Chaetomidium leptoderma]
MFKNFTFQYLRWRRPTGPLQALPDGIERFFVDTPGGKLEVLYAHPPPPSATHGSNADGSASPSPLFFVHGGMGGAFVWIEYLQFFAARGIPCYAVSMRGHGGSYYPSYLRMVYATTKRMLADDVLAGLRWVQEREGGREVVLAGHSSGGGLAQLILSEKEARVKGLVLVAAAPGNGSDRAYQSWMKLDPWFLLRMILHLGHPNSPLSHPALTKRAFFSDQQSDTYVEAFQARSSPYESFIWALGMTWRFVNQQNVISRIASRAKGQSILVLNGELDKIMTLPIMEDLASMYRTGYSSMVRQGRFQGEDAEVVPMQGEGNRDNAGHGVRFAVVPGAGHHLQNDVTWKVGAQKLLAFYEQL